MTDLDIMRTMEQIEYGFLDENGNNIIEVDPKRWDENFYDFYYLLSPEELLEKKCGVCWDQVELERTLFEKEGIQIHTYFIYTDDYDNLPSHTFLTYKKTDKVYWFEHSWYKFKGIHGYKTTEELLSDVKKKFIENNPTRPNAKTFVYEYLKPKYHIKCQEFYDYCANQKLVEPI